MTSAPFTGAAQGPRVSSICGDSPAAKKVLIGRSDKTNRVFGVLVAVGSRPVFFNAFGDILAANGPGAPDVRSLDAVRTWYHTAWIGKAVPWTPGLEAYIRDVAQPDAVGTLHVKPNDDASAAVFATLGSWKRDYTKVQAPTLALYATFFPLDSSDPALVQKLHDFNQNISYRSGKPAWSASSASSKT